MLESVIMDVRYACRWLIRSPAFTGVAVASLAVGIGFNTAMFSAVDALLFRPLPIEHPERIVDVYTRGGDGDTYATSSYPDYLDFRQRNEVFTDMAGFSPSIAALKAGDQSRMALGEVVTGNYFELLGVRAAMGRMLRPEDGRPGAPRVVVLSHGMWSAEYGRDPSAIGRVVHIHGQPYTIVGIAPARFSGMMPMLRPQMWTPVAWVEDLEPAGIQDVVPSPTGTTRLDRRGQRWMFIKARLKDGETVARAKANLDVIAAQLEAAYPATNKNRPVALAAGVRIHPLADRMLRTVAVGLMGGVALVLLIACANVTNILLARATARQKEVGVRLAIGAGRGRLVRQLLTESVVLAGLGAIAGVGLAFVLLRLVDAIPAPLPVPIALGLGIDARVLAFTAAVATLAGVVAGLVPALRATRANLASDLKGEATQLATAGRRWTLREGLVVLQAAVTIVLLVSAGLLTRSLLAAGRMDLGFKPEGIAIVSTELGLVGNDAARATQIYERVIERVRALPGVQSASRAIRQPLAINYNRNTIFFPDRQQAGDEGIPIAATWVDAAYFATLGVPLVSGRNFGPSDTVSSPRVAIVNDAFARTYWPGADAVGRRFRLRGPDGPEYQVVGVATDYKVQTVGEPPTPYIHYPIAQRPSTGQVFIARTAMDAGALLAGIRRELLSLEPNAVFFESQTMEAQVATTLTPARLAAQAIGLVGLVATLLAATGLYGVVAYAVTRRAREIGIRMALGATPGRVLGMVMRQGLGSMAAGLAIGLVLSWVTARALASTLYGVGTTDPLAWGGAIAVLLCAAALANYIPARRAARVDPSIALRLE